MVPHNKNTAYLVLDSGVGPGTCLRGQAAHICKYQISLFLPATWLVDAAKELSPSAILHGVDIEQKMFNVNRPPNISLSVNSITNLPLEWTGRFDFVHQRLLLTALRKDEWVAAISNMHRTLRQGGWIQLGEVGEWHSGPVTANHRRLVHALFAARQLVLDVSKDLPKLVKEGWLQKHICRDSSASSCRDEGAPGTRQLDRRFPRCKNAKFNLWRVRICELRGSV